MPFQVCSECAGAGTRRACVYGFEREFTCDACEGEGGWNMDSNLEDDKRLLLQQEGVADVEIVGEQLLVTTGCAQRAFRDADEALEWLKNGDCGTDPATEHLVGMALCPCTSCVPNIWNGGRK